MAPLAAKAADGWHLFDKDGATLGVFDWVISTAPPVQTARLFADVGATKGALQNIALQGCYTLMIGFNRPWDKPWMAAKLHASPIEWIAVNSTKPGRNSAVTCLVVHSSNGWAEAHIDDAMPEAEVFLRHEFAAISGIDTAKADYFACHRWRYALVETPATLAPYCDAAQGLASVGDWCSASRIEDAWTNATALAKQLTALF